MAAQPGASMIHVSFEGFTLFIAVRKVIEPDNEVIIGEVVVVEIGPVACCIKSKLLLLRDQVEEVQGILGKINVVHLSAGRIEGGDLEARRLCVQRRSEKQWEYDQAKEASLEGLNFHFIIFFHRWPLLSTRYNTASPVKGELKDWEVDPAATGD